MSGSTGGRYRDALRQRDFRLMVVAYVVDALGGWAYSVVLAVYVWDRTHSTQWLATMASAGWLTSLLIGGYAGVLADRYERTRVMITSALANAVIMCVIAVVVGTDSPLVLLLVLRILSSAAGSPYRPASGALTPEIVGEKDLAAANGLFSTLESLTVVLGPAAGGLLLLTGEPVTGVIVNAASFVIAAAIVARLRIRATGDAAPGENAFKQWLVGIKALGRERVALVLVLFCGLDSAVYGASTVIYVPLSEHLGTGANGYSYLLAGAALGGVLAAGLANKLGSSSRLAPVILGSIVLQALPFAVTAAVHAPILAFVLQVISGAGMIVVDVLAYTALQRDLPREVLGRVLGVFDAIVLGFIVAASFIGASLLTSEGLHTTLLVFGVAFPLLALVGLPALLKADRESAAAVARLAPRVRLLAALDLFTGASNSVLERLATAAVEQQTPAGTVIIREGDEADALWILVTGELAIEAVGPDGNTIELPDVEAPSYVGELGLLHSRPRSATVTTKSDATLLRIDGTEFLNALAAAPPSVSLKTLAGVRLARTPIRDDVPVLDGVQD
jgi:MFS family permease